MDFMMEEKGDDFYGKEQIEEMLFELEDSFHHFGGVPKEILVDNAAQFVISRVGHIIKWNLRFLEFCGHYRIKPVACKVKRPKTKGKVES